MDDNIDPRILQMIEELCERAKHAIAVAVHDAKDMHVHNPNLNSELKSQLSGIVKTKEPDAKAPIKGRL
ncbi:hypothetical protein FJP69_19565 [Stenotrophomonas maltophilia]|nr:hypothetical protein FJP69_19565 [Stenotrophomonas maltophilia]